ncbi:MAG: hypothetical protein JXQ30_16625 [Spirochaetes bacterium]|nr:hypothetical protein [Spirochaetota bacterium]
MEKVLGSKERLLLIRKGNEIFNNGDIEKAARIFTTTAYRDGLIRVGDYYYFEKKDALKALQFYNDAKYERGIKSISERIASVIQRWLSEPQRLSKKGTQSASAGEETHTP